MLSKVVLCHIFLKVVHDIQYDIQFLRKRFIEKFPVNNQVNRHLDTVTAVTVSKCRFTWLLTGNFSMNLLRSQKAKYFFHPLVTHSPLRRLHETRICNWMSTFLDPFYIFTEVLWQGLVEHNGCVLQNWSNTCLVKLYNSILYSLARFGWTKR